MPRTLNKATKLKTLYELPAFISGLLRSHSWCGVVFRSTCIYTRISQSANNQMVHLLFKHTAVRWGKASQKASAKERGFLILTNLSPLTPPFLLIAIPAFSPRGQCGGATQQLLSPAARELLFLVMPKHFKKDHHPADSPKY